MQILKKIKKFHEKQNKKFRGNKFFFGKKDFLKQKLQSLRKKMFFEKIKSNFNKSFEVTCNSKLCVSIHAINLIKIEQL